MPELPQGALGRPGARGKGSPSRVLGPGRALSLHFGNSVKAPLRGEDRTHIHAGSSAKGICSRVIPVKVSLQGMFPAPFF